MTNQNHYLIERLERQQETIKESRYLLDNANAQIEGQLKEIEALTERNKRLEEAVKLGAETFRGYAILHEAKPDMEKAKRNYVLAERLEAALEEEKE